MNIFDVEGNDNLRVRFDITVEARDLLRQHAVNEFGRDGESFKSELPGHVMIEVKASTYFRLQDVALPRESLSDTILRICSVKKQ